MKEIFLAYPFDLSWIEDEVRKVAEGLANVVVARDQLEAKPLLHKIQDMMANADLCLFDLTTHNPNVALELGLAITEQYDFRILYCKDENLNPKPNRSSDLFADMRGWDSIIYGDQAELGAKLREYMPAIIASSGTRKRTILAMLEEELQRIDRDLRLKTRLGGTIGPFFSATEYSPGYETFSVGRWKAYQASKAVLSLNPSTLGLIGEAYGRVEQLMTMENQYHAAGASIVAANAAKISLRNQSGDALAAVERALETIRAASHK